jgi:hypothetical protein
LRASLHPALQAALNESDDVFIPSGTDPKTYVAALVESIRKHACVPMLLSAQVTAAGFPDLPVGSRISGLCVAHSDGYWLIYEESRDRFLCFWGTEPSQLGAPGIYGSPAYCWSA